MPKPTTIPTPSPTSAPTTPTASPSDTSNNIATMPEDTLTTPTTSSPVNTATVDDVQESDLLETEATIPDGRIVDTVLNKILMPTDKCATIISDSFLERVDADGYRCASVSQTIKDFYWDEFKKNYFWEEQDDAKMRTAWKTKASLAYSQYIFNMKNAKRNKTKKKHHHVSKQVWASWWEKWWEKWNSEEFKKISEKNKLNRRNGVPDSPARPTHTSQSASHVKIASRLVSYASTS